MLDISLMNYIQHAWNAFRSREPTNQNLGYASTIKPDRNRNRYGFDRSIVTAVLNRIAIDVAAISIRHVRVDDGNAYEKDIDSSLNYCFNVEANLDQTGRAFFQDAVMSMLDEGVVAIVPTDATLDPRISGSYEVNSLRTGRIVAWYPQHIRVLLYNEKTGLRQELDIPKKMAAIIENPLYAVMNEPNSVLQRLIRKLNLLDAIDEQSGSGKLDLIIQLPHVIKTELRRQEANKRLDDLERQLAGRKLGIGYVDATERITQLNRPAENNLMTQIQYLTSMLYSQLGTTESVFDGTADEATMLNYWSRTIEPILAAITGECKRKFLTKTAITQKQSIMYFKSVFKLAPVGEIANIADKFTRNEILSPNEVRSIIGMEPSDDPKADELRNRNINAPAEPPEEPPFIDEGETEEAGIEWV